MRWVCVSMTVNICAQGGFCGNFDVLAGCTEEARRMGV